MSAPRSTCRFAFRRAGLLILAVLISSTASLAQSSSRDAAAGSVWGRVLRAGDDRPIRHARVELLNSSMGWASSTLTDGNSKFDFAGLPQVTYQVTVTEPGYERLEGTAEVAGKTGPLVLRLRKTEVSAAPRNATPINDNVVRCKS